MCQDSVRKKAIREMDDMAPTEAIEALRPLLFAIAYQMTGSASEAEDIVQETFLRYQQAQVEVQALKAYLTTITTRLALDYAKSARHRREQYVGTWLPEPLLTVDDSALPSAVAERQESLSMAFLVLLETLTPPERAIFLLREVFDFPYATIASIVEKSVAACRQTFHRAQQHIAAHQPRFAPPDAEQQLLVAHFLLTCEQGEMDALLQDLKQDITLWGDGGGKAPAVRNTLHGSAIIGRFFAAVTRKAPANARTVLTTLNNMPALVVWEGEMLTTAFLFAVADQTIRVIYAIRNPDKLTYLARQLADGS